MSWNEKHYTIQELAVLWAVSYDTVRRHVLNEPETINLNTRPKGVRKNNTIRVPESTAEKIYARMIRAGQPDEAAK